MTLPQDLGPVLLLRVHLAPPELPRALGLPAADAWFCRWIQLTPPRGAPLRFPCYQWLEGPRSLVLREGAGKEGAGRGLGLVCGRARGGRSRRRKKLAGGGQGAGGRGEDGDGDGWRWGEE